MVPAVALGVTVRAWYRSWLEEISFRTGMTVLTGLLAIIGGAIAAAVLTGRAGPPGRVPGAVASHRALAAPPANVAYPLRPAHRVARATLAPPGHAVRQAALVPAAGTNASGRLTWAAPSAGPGHPGQGQGQGRWWPGHGWPPPGWQQGHGHDGVSGRGDRGGDRQGGDD